MFDSTIDQNIPNISGGTQINGRLVSFGPGHLKIKKMQKNKPGVRICVYRRDIF